MTAGAQLIPADRLADWRPNVAIGVIGGMLTNRAAFTNVVGLDNTGAADCTAVIQHCLDICPSNQAVVLPSGTFKTTGDLHWNSYVTLRGQGLTSTTLKQSGTLSYHTYDPTGDNNFYAHHNSGVSGATVTAGMTVGSSNITIASTSGYVVGQEIEVSCKNSENQTNDIVVIKDDEANAFSIVRKAIITATNGTQITFWPPLVYDMTGSTPQVVEGSPDGFIKYFGVEHLTIDCSSNSYAIANNSSQTYCSWYYDVKMFGFVNYGFYGADNLFMQFEHCWIGPGQGTGPNHSGLAFEWGSCSLIQDTIFETAMPGLELNFGDSQLGVLYCFMTNANASSISIDVNHGPHNMLILVEGSVFPEVMSDGYFGSDSCLTLHRNFLTGWDGSETWPIKLGRWSRKDNVTGNMIGVPGRSDLGPSYGMPNLGNNDSTGTAPPWSGWGAHPGPSGFQERDTGVTNLLVLKGNWYGFNNTTESLGGSTLSNSLAYASRPAWFPTSLTWPPIPTTSNSINQSNVNNATYRFFHNNADAPNNLGSPVGPAAALGTGSIMQPGAGAVIFLGQP